MSNSREYPERPVVGVGGVVVRDGRAPLIRRGSEPLKGQWSIPGGTLELGETLEEGVARELREEVGLDVRVIGLIEVFDRIFPAPDAERSVEGKPESRPQYHFVIADYLCEAPAGEARAGGDVTDIAWVRESELAVYHLTPTATRILKKAFAMARARQSQA